MVTAPCCFPSCTTPATTTNRAGKAVCEGHRAVVVAESASWMGEGYAHRKREGEDR